MDHIELGQRGEEIAVHFLRTKGYEIVDRNYRWGKGELDVVCKRNGMLVVAEVKTRNSNALGAPYLSVTRTKQRQIIKIANHYLLEKNLNMEVRFDVISIVLNRQLMDLEHIESAFYAM